MTAAIPAPIAIEGTPPSAELRARLAAEGRPVLLAFSRGKDSIAAWLALREAGVEVIPYHLHGIPGLQFVADSLAYFEDWFGTRIIDLPHPSLYRQLGHAVFQPAERIQVLLAARLPLPTYAAMNTLVCEELDLPEDTWVCDGVRAADSPNRRTSIVTHGPVNEKARKQKIVWDWRKAHVYDAIKQAGIKLPPEYDWFGRSYDGLDRRFLEPLREHAPADYQRVLNWFPLADLDLPRPLPARSPGPRPGHADDFKARAKREADRFKQATDSRYWLQFCFRTPAARDAFAAAAGAESRYVPGEKLPQQPAAPDSRPRAMRLLEARGTRGTGLAARLAPKAAASPTAALELPGDLAGDCAAEMTALLAALTAPPQAEPANVLDSPHHVTAWWPDREAKHAWLTATGCDVLGNKYLDGHKAAATLGITLDNRTTRAPAV